MKIILVTFEAHYSKRKDSQFVSGNCLKEIIKERFALYPIQK